MQNKILRAQQVCERLDISLPTLWRWRKARIFPDPVKIEGTSIQGWTESTVDDWIEKKFTGQGEV